LAHPPNTVIFLFIKYIISNFDVYVLLFVTFSNKNFKIGDLLREKQVAYNADF